MLEQPAERVNTMKNGIIFPRYSEDIATKRRTLFHAVEDDYEIGEQLCLVGHPDVVRGLAVVVTDVKRTRLEDLTPDDEVKLCCSKQDYLARWNDLHPGCSEAFAIEFRYGFADETSRT